MNFKSPPISKQKLDILISKVFTSSFSGRHVTLAYFRGAGKPFELKYLLRNIGSLSNAPSDKVYIWFDLHHVKKHQSSALKAALASLLMHPKLQLDDSFKKALQNLTSKDFLSTVDFMNFIQEALLNKGLFVTFVFEHFGLVYSNTPNRNELLYFVNDLRKLSLTNVSCIFLTGLEFNTSTLQRLDDLKDHFLANIVWGNELFYDAESIIQTFKNHEKLHNVKFSKEYINLVSKTALGDPTSVRRLMLLAARNKSFEKSFISAKGQIKDVVSLIDPTWYDNRFIDIIGSLSSATVEKLATKRFEELSEFITKCGLLNIDKPGDSSKVTFINPMFEHFFTKTLPALFKSNDLNVYFTQKGEKTPKDYLSGQEYLVLKYLEGYKESVVSKDSIAQVIWGDNWEEKYSDWALDKLISNLRKKLSANSYSGKIKTLKGKGIMLFD